MARLSEFPQLSTPPLAVLIPAFNAGAKIHRTLESIWTQRVECEIFVIDDGSSTPLTIQAPKGAHPTHVIRLDKNQGIVGALNYGLELILARGFRYVARQDAGDTDLAHRLATQMDFLDANQRVNLVGSSVDFLDSEGFKRFSFRALRSDKEIRKRMHYSPAFIHPSVMIRTSALEQIGLYRESAPHAEDYDLFFRLMALGPVANCSEVLVHTEYDPDGISMGKRQASLRSRLKLQLHHFDLGSIHSYLGVAQTLCFFLLPYSIVTQIKKRHQNRSFPGVMKRRQSRAS